VLPEKIQFHWLDWHFCLTTPEFSEMRGPLKIYLTTQNGITEDQKTHYSLSVLSLLLSYVLFPRLVFPITFPTDVTGCAFNNQHGMWQGRGCDVC
jgi:hypothetical protein